MVFSAALLRDPACGRKRAAAAALVHQPEDATRYKAIMNGNEDSKASKGSSSSKIKKSSRSGRGSKATTETGRKARR